MAELEQKPSCTTCAYKHTHFTDPPCGECGAFEHYEKCKEPDIFLMEMDHRISNLNQAPKTQHSEGMRVGFMHARAIYKGTRK